MARMKTIGLLGGMSWESTALYYSCINQTVSRTLGGLHSARLVMVSLDFDEIESLQSAGDWNQAEDLLAEAARRLRAAGADFFLICSNTMHRVAPRVEDAAGIPLLHIADATARRIIDAGVTTVGLLGTRYTMEEDFYRGRLEQRHGLTVKVPARADREHVNRVIYEELCLGSVREASQREYLRIIEALRADGAGAIIAGCTEIGMLVKQDHMDLPLFDTTVIHAEEAVAWSLSDTK